MPRFYMIYSVDLQRTKSNLYEQVFFTTQLIFLITLLQRSSNNKWWITEGKQI